MGRLSDLCADRGLASLSGRLLGLAGLIGPDLMSLERQLAAIAHPNDVVGVAAERLVALGGKRLRPVCVMLAARAGSGFSDAALDLAIAAELTHNATLLHDDVIDHADSRRGQPTARALFGNAASIFAGDWLLIEALRRVRRAGVDGTLDHLLATIDEMIQAEALQLENKGRIDLDRAQYDRIADGKSASLFRWALDAGGRAGGLDDRCCAALRDYGRQIGVAFQLIDDLLDLTGDTKRTGKALFTDLREGKMTYPLIIAFERNPRIKPGLERIARGGDATADDVFDEVVAALHDTGAVMETRDAARSRSRAAIEQLESLPDNPATVALRTVAEAIVDRWS